MSLKTIKQVKMSNKQMMLLNKEFYFLGIGQFLSSLGDSCGTLALSWWILDKTHSPAVLGSLLVPAMIIRFMLKSLLAPLADRYSRIKLIIFGDYWQIFIWLILAFFVYLDEFNFFYIMLLFAISALGSSIMSVAINAITPSLVTKENLHKAFRQEQIIYTVAGLVGGIFGGVLLSKTNTLVAFLFNASSFFIAVIFSLLIRIDTVPKRNKTKNNSLKTWWKDFVEGWHFVYKVKILLFASFYTAFISIFIQLAFVSLPILVKENQKMPAWFLGLLETSAALGALIGGISLGKIITKLKKDYLVFVAILLIGFFIIFFSFFLHSPVFSFLILFGISFSSVLVSNIFFAQLQIVIPNRIRARYFAVHALISGLSMSLSSYLSGQMVENYGLKNVWFYSGICVIIFSFLILVNKKFRKFISLDGKELTTFMSNLYPKQLKDEVYRKNKAYPTTANKSQNST